MFFFVYFCQKDTFQQKTISPQFFLSLKKKMNTQYTINPSATNKKSDSQVDYSKQNKIESDFPPKSVYLFQIIKLLFARC